MAASTTASATASVVTARNAESEQDKRQIATLQDFLRKYHKEEHVTRRDVLDGKYQIDLNTPLPTFSNATARAYAVKDLTNESRQCFGLVCDHSHVQRHRAIQLLKLRKHPNILPLLAAGVVKLSKPEEERMIIVYERPLGKKLSEVLAEHQGEITDLFIVKNILAPLILALEHLDSSEIAHGNINADNIYYVNGVPVLGDCVSAPCGLNQIYYYETLERTQAMPSGKGEGNTSCDYYALAVLTLYILYGPEHFRYYTPESLAAAIMREGAYNALLRSRNTSEIFYDFFRALLTHSSEERWTYRQLKPWADGKRFNMLLPPPPLVTVRPFEFEGKEVYTRREVAHLLYTHWDKIYGVLENGYLFNWVNVSLRSKELSSNISKLSKTAVDVFRRSEIQYMECVMRILLYLDPIGPMRMGPLSLHIDGVEMLCANLYMKKEDKSLQVLMQFIELNWAAYWVEQAKKSIKFVMPPAIATTIAKLEQLRLSIRNTSLGFGQERLLYDLNPEMPCQSKIFQGTYVNSLPSALAKFDEIAPTFGTDKELLDRHLAAFISSKLKLQHETRLRELSNMPAMAENMSIIALKLLAEANRKANNAPRYGLTHLLALRVFPFFDKLQSRTMRAYMKNALLESAQAGDLLALSRLVISSDYIASDNHGFHYAWSSFQSNVARIASYKRGDNLDLISGNLGAFASKLVAYGIFFITIYLFLRRQ